MTSYITSHGISVQHTDVVAGAIRRVNEIQLRHQKASDYVLARILIETPDILTRVDAKTISVQEFSEGQSRGFLDPIERDVQGRRFRAEQLLLELHLDQDASLPREVRAMLAREQSLVDQGRRVNPETGESTPRTPPGLVLAHGHLTPAREGYDYLSSARLGGADINSTENVINRRVHSWAAEDFARLEAAKRSGNTAVLQDFHDRLLPLLPATIKRIVGSYSTPDGI